MTATSVFKEKMEALQLVIASLGGLLDSIIGYYFGESASSRNSAISTNEEATQYNEDGVIIDDGDDMVVAPSPFINPEDEVL